MGCGLVCLGVRVEESGCCKDFFMQQPKWLALLLQGRSGLRATENPQTMGPKSQPSNPIWRFRVVSGFTV